MHRITTSESGRLKKFWPIFSLLSNKPFASEIIVSRCSKPSCFVTSNVLFSLYGIFALVIARLNIALSIFLKNQRFRVTSIPIPDRKIYTITALFACHKMSISSDTHLITIKILFQPSLVIFKRILWI